MATHIELVDDIDGSPGAETYTFGWQGKTYEIDLAEKGYAALEKALAKFVANARPAATGGRVAGTAKRGATKARTRASANGDGGKERTTAIRAWATEKGFDVGVRGRLPKEVVEAYDEAHSA